LIERGIHESHQHATFRLCGKGRSQNQSGTEQIDRVQAGSLQWATETENDAIETAIAERAGHLIEAYAKLRHSTSVFNSTFASMAVAVLVVGQRRKNSSLEFGG
jgi:hypothetical protein